MLQAGGGGFHIVEQYGLARINLQAFRDTFASDRPPQVIADDCVIHDCAGDAEAGGGEIGQWMAFTFCAFAKVVEERFNIGEVRGLYSEAINRAQSVSIYVIKNQS